MTEFLASPAVIAMALCVPLGLVLEHFWSRPRTSLRTRLPNIGYGIVAAFAEFAFVEIKIALIDHGIRMAGVAGLIDLRLPMGGIAGSILSVLLLMFVGDFFLYWMHRFQHEIPFLWQEHIVHHCDTEVDVTSTTRLHLFSLVIRAILVSVPMAVLFKFSTPEVVALGLIPLIWLYVIHLNLPLGFGKLWWVATSPQFHRIHHSIEPRHIDKNYAAFFPVWDIAFGSAYRPRRGEYPQAGVTDVMASSITDMLVLPFRRWARQIEILFLRKS